MLNYVTNFMILAVLFFTVKIVVTTEKRSIQRWMNTDLSRQKFSVVEALKFWQKVFENRVRLIAVIVILASQRGLIGMLFSMILLAGITYFLTEPKYDMLRHINWEDEKTQKIATVITIALAVCVVFRI